MIVDVLWYSTAIFAIWGSSLGGIAFPALGLLYPFRLVAAALFIILLFRYRKADWGIGRQSWFTILPILGYMVLHSLLSLIWSASMVTTAKAVLNFLFVAVFLVMFLSIVRDKKQFDRLMIALSANFLVILFVGLYEAFSNNYLFCDPAGVDMAWRTNAFGLSYPVVCFTNPNDFAFTISLTVPLMLYVLDEALPLKGWLRAVLKVLVIVLSFFVMMQTCSRLGYIVYFLAIGLYMAIQIKKSRLETAVLALLAVFLVLALTGTIKVKFELKVQGKIRGAEPITEISQEDTSTSIRLTLIEKGLRVTRDTWGLGAGAKNSPAIMARYTDIPATEDFGITDYHFFYLELMADYGVIPLVALLCLQGGAFFAAIYVLRKKRELRWLAVASLPGVVGFALASGNCSSSMFVYAMWIQFAIWSLLTARVVPDWLGSRKRLQPPPKGKTD